MIDVRYDSIVFSAYTKLMELADCIASTRKQSKIDAYLKQATQIRYYLRALRFTDYIDDDRVNQILQCLIDVSEIQNYPVAPSLPTLAVPNTGTTIIIEGTQGPRGKDGGGTDFSAIVSFDSVVDSFDITSARAARWDYSVYGVSGQRVGVVYGGWSSDGLSINKIDTGTEDIYGNTDGIEFDVTLLGSTIQLVAIVTSGTWTVEGSRYFIPNNGSGVVPSSGTLSDGKIYIGDTSNIAQEQTVSGVITLTNTGVTSFTPLVIVNNDISASAGISVTKLESMTASRAVVTDVSGFITTSSATATEVGYLSGVTSGIQAQLDTKLSAVSGAISTVVAVDLTANRAVISNPSGKIAVSSVTSTELGYVSGATSSIQTQLNSKLTVVGPTLLCQLVDIGDWDMDATPTVAISTATLAGLGIDVLKIRGVSVTIRSDADDVRLNLQGFDASLNLNGRVVSWTTTFGLGLERRTGGFFDSTDYNATGFNRGWCLITYEP